MALSKDMAETLFDDLGHEGLEVQMGSKTVDGTLAYHVTVDLASVSHVDQLQKFIDLVKQAEARLEPSAFGLVVR